MQGPFPVGTCSRIETSTDWERCLVRGHLYRVVKPFRDFDNSLHVGGEEWYFIGSNFLPYDDGLSVFVATDDGSEWHICLCWRPEDQSEICERFTEYVEVVEGKKRMYGP